MNLGFRSAAAQVQNLELRLAKARDVLATMEMDVAHELAFAFQNLTEAYTTAQSNLSRRAAAREFLRLATEKNRVGTATLDLVLRAQASVAQAERDLYTSVVDYNQSIVEVYYRKGTLLDYDNVQLAEGAWTPEAYQDALRRAWARSHAHPNRLLCTEPPEFVLTDYDGQHIVPPTLEDLGPAPLDAAAPLPVPADPAVPPPAPAGESLPAPTLPDARVPEEPSMTGARHNSPAGPGLAPLIPVPEPRGIRPASGEAQLLPGRATAAANRFFEDTEHTAPVREDLELKLGRDLLE
jgi:hypothetical protein